MTRPLSEAERWCELPPDERPQLPVTDPLAQQVFLQFAPLMKRVLLRDPYALMSVSLYGFERDCVEEGTPTYEMRMLLAVQPSGRTFEETSAPLLGPDAPDSELEDLFTAYPPKHLHWDDPLLGRLLNRPRRSSPPRTTPETPVDPVPPPVCEVCFLIDGDGRECGHKPDTAKCPECGQCYFMCKCSWPEHWR